MNLDELIRAWPTVTLLAAMIFMPLMIVTENELWALVPIACCGVGVRITCMKQRDFRKSEQQ